MLLLITVMCVIAEKKKLQLNIALAYVVVIFIIGGILIGGVRHPGPPSGYAYARTFTTKAYRTNVPYQYHNKKCVPYFLAKIEAYRTVPYCHP